MFYGRIAFPLFKNLLGMGKLFGSKADQVVKIENRDVVSGDLSQAVVPIAIENEGTELQTTQNVLLTPLIAGDPGGIQEITATENVVEITATLGVTEISTMGSTPIPTGFTGVPEITAITPGYIVGDGSGSSYSTSDNQTVFKKLPKKRKINLDLSFLYKIMNVDFERSCLNKPGYVFEIQDGIKLCFPGLITPTITPTFTITPTIKIEKFENIVVVDYTARIYLPYVAR